MKTGVASRPILVIDDRHEVLKLTRILLETEGYETRGYSYQEATLDRLRGAAACVALLDLVPESAAPWLLLDQLRADATMCTIGIVVTSDSPALIDRALSTPGLGIAAGLVMPFDLDTLYNAIAMAEQANGTAMPAPDTLGPLLDLLADTLRQNRQRVLTRWVQRLSMLEVFRCHSALSPIALQGEGAAFIDGIIDTLAQSRPKRVVPATGLLLDQATVQAHADLRREQGLPIEALAREVAALRRAFLHELRPVLSAQGLQATAMWRAQGRLLGMLDELLNRLLAAHDGGRAR